MSKINKYILLLFIIISCKKDDVSEALPSSDHIKFFGFTLIDAFWDDPSDNEIKTNYSDEVYQFSNTADILVVNPSDNIIGRMYAIADLQMKSVLHLNELFFEQVNTGGQSGAIYDLRSDYQNRWNEFVAVNQLQSNQELIQTFYIGEESTWNAITFSELKLATDFVKSTFPNIPIMLIEAYPVIDQLKIPNSVDWIGFDHYFIKDPKNDVAFLNELSLLKSKMNDSQNIILVMDTHYIKSAHGDFGGIDLEEMKDVATSYFELAKEESKVIGVLGYFWPSGFDSSESIGARHMPQSVKEEYKRIGKIITGKK
ncbi:MAG TPA: hypothetical protein DDZ39_10185 [Flavobacteriaceae bacterium]|nr:hypothetical protein [Flavobacteriaceae bacterium]